MRNTLFDTSNDPIASGGEGEGCEGGIGGGDKGGEEGGGGGGGDKGGEEGGESGDGGDGSIGGKRRVTAMS